MKNPTTLTKENRKHLVQKLIESQDKITRTWQSIFRDEDKNIPNWKSIKNEMLFKIDGLQTDIDKISGVLINNKWIK